MILEIYSIKDEKVGVFMPPTSVPHLVEMTRSITQAMRDPNSKLSLYPGDYSLYYISKFDQDSGHFIIDPSGPRFIAQISSFSQQNGVTPAVPNVKN